MVISDVSSTEIFIIWNEPLDEYTNGIIRSYDIKLIELDTGTIIMENVVNTEITLTSLHPYYVYEVSIAAITTERGPFSAPLTVTTDPAGMTCPILLQYIIIRFQLF